MGSECQIRSARLVCEPRNPAGLARALAALREHYRFTPRDLEFLTLHMTADAEHSREGKAMVAALARTDRDREEAA